MNMINIPVNGWRKSRHSNGSGACVEVATWRKSRYSNGSGECVEVATRREDPHVAVRDSKDPAGPVLTITPAAWHTFTTKIKAGQLG